VTRNSRSLVVAFLAVVVCLPAKAFTQVLQPPPGQPQGLFGAVRSDNVRTRLDITASLVEGYDSDVPTTLLSTIDPGSLQSRGFTTIANGTAAYAWRGARVDVGINANSVIRHYSQSGETKSAGHNAGIGLAARLTDQTTLMVNQAAAYSPSYLSGLFPTGTPVAPGDPGTIAPDYSVSELDAYTYTTTATLRQNLDRRSNLLFSGEYQYSDRSHETEQWQDISAQRISVQYSRNIKRRTALFGRYRYRAGEFGYGGDGRTTEQGVDFGVDHVRALSATRRAVFRFNFGASRADIPVLTLGESPLRRQYLASGDAEIEYQFSRTWHARANYRRALEYVIDIPEPVFANGFGAVVDGLISRRVDVSGSGGYASGESVLNRDSLRFDTYTGDVRVRFSLTRQLATYGEYLYYYYRFRGVQQLFLSVPPGLERSGLRAGLMVWMPALRR